MKDDSDYYQLYDPRQEKLWDLQDAYDSQARQQRQPHSSATYQLSVLSITFNHTRGDSKDLGRCAMNLRSTGMTFVQGGLQVPTDVISPPEWAFAQKPKGVAWCAFEILSADYSAAIAGPSKIADRGPIILVSLAATHQGKPFDGKLTVGATGGGVMGEVPEQEVTFVDGKANNIEFQLRYHKIQTILGVGHLHSGLAE